METNLQLFEQNNLAAFQKLAELNRQKKALEDAEKEVKAAIETSMEEYGVQSIKNDYITISYVEASSSTTVDLAALKKSEPALYADLLADYPKTTERKAYVKFNVK